MSSIQSVLVTGGAGFIGSHVVEALLAAGKRVRVLDSLVSQVHKDQVPRSVPAGAEFCRGDVTDGAAVSAALDGVDAVMHLAAEVGVAQSNYEGPRFVHANSVGTATLLQSVQRRSAPLLKLVVASSMTVYGEGAYECSACGPFFPPPRAEEQLAARRWEVECDHCSRVASPRPTREDGPLSPTSIYAVTKRDQEEMCLLTGRAFGIPTVALRYFIAYGPRQSLSNPYTGVCSIFATRLLNGQRPLLFEDGEQSRDFVHVRDLVRANLLALESETAGGQAINIGSGTTIAIRQVAEDLARGLEVKLPPESTGRYRAGDIRHCVADLSLARRLLGYEPAVRWDEGVRELLDWVRSERDVVASGRALAELEAHRLVR